MLLCGKLNDLCGSKSFYRSCITSYCSIIAKIQIKGQTAKNRDMTYLPFQHCCILSKNDELLELLSWWPTYNFKSNHCNWYQILSTCHYNNVIMSAMASQITDISIVCLTGCSGADQGKHQSSASLVFIRGTQRRPVDSPHKGSIMRKMTSSWYFSCRHTICKWVAEAWVHERVQRYGCHGAVAI